MTNVTVSKHNNSPTLVNANLKNNFITDCPVSVKCSLKENVSVEDICDRDVSVDRGVSWKNDTTCACHSKQSCKISCLDHDASTVESRLSRHASFLLSQSKEKSKCKVCNLYFSANDCDSSYDVNLSVNQRPSLFTYYDESLFGAQDTPPESESSFEINDVDNEVNLNIEMNENKDRFNFFHWNVDGLYSKLFDDDFMEFITSFDFVCLAETFLLSFNLNDIFPDHDVYYQPAVKLSADGRPSGGIFCLIRKKFKPFIKRQIKIDAGNFLMFIIDKALFDLDKDMLYVCAYVPPEGSRYYTCLNLDSDGVSLLENCLVDNVLLDSDVYTLICGDMNSRTADVSQPVTFDLDNFQDMHLGNNFDVQRRSQDTVINGFGKTLINMCISLNLSIMNGMSYGDQDGRFTYISDRGSSVNDYFLVSSDLFATIFDKCTLNVMDHTFSKHMPLSFSVSFPRENEDLSNSNSKKNIYVDKFIWNIDKEQTYLDALVSERIYVKFEEALRMINVNLNLALNLFNDFITEAASCMKKKICLNRKSKNDWFDLECRNKRKNLRKLLKKYRKSLANNDREQYCIARREYKRLIQRKKKDFNRSIIDSLTLAIEKQKEFWDTMHKICPRKKFTKNDITVEDWYNHFKSLLDKDIASVDNNDVVDDQDQYDAEFNMPISKEEVQLAISKIKSGKAPGPDKIIGELLRHASNVILPFLVRFFNEIFDRGIYPENWTEAIILPLYKKGNANHPGNYRGISLSDVSSKIYGTIINRRLQKWVKEHNITNEYQAGFKAGYSTIDHVFTLLACVTKQFSNNRKLYVAFIDFEKCFDTINRHLLWPILIKNNIKGKLLKSIQSMYASVKARVRCGVNFTEQINCTLGVKQGDICSPILFCLFINELALEVIRNGRHGATFLLDPYELFILLLADDLVLISETIVGLQNQLNNLHTTATSLQLRVNIDKSNIVVFRKGGYLGRREHWYFNGSLMPVVNAYKYLGLYLSTKISFTTACRDISSKAKRALLCVLQRLRQYDNHSFDILVKIFDSQIQPIMQYGSEIWGLEAAAQHCENTHLFALKKFLCIDKHTPNDLVYKELNRYPITINSVVNCIRYWLKLVQMQNHRLPRKAYTSLYTLDERGHTNYNWVSKVRNCLCVNGFRNVWMQQGVGDVKSFLKILKQRLIDVRWQNVNGHLNGSERFEFYNMFCEKDFAIPVYLYLDVNRQLKYMMTKFRFGVSNLNVHYFRYRNVNPNRMLCQYCKTEIESELHFILVCPLYEEIRNQFIPLKYYRSPNLFKLNLLLASKSRNIVENLCCYIYNAFKIRGIVCE